MIDEGIRDVLSKKGEIEMFVIFELNKDVLSAIVFKLAFFPRIEAIWQVSEIANMKWILTFICMM